MKCTIDYVLPLSLSSHIRSNPALRTRRLLCGRCRSNKTLLEQIELVRVRTFHSLSFSPSFFPPFLIWPFLPCPGIIAPPPPVVKTFFLSLSLSLSLSSIILFLFQSLFVHMPVNILPGYFWPDKKEELDCVLNWICSPDLEINWSVQCC